MMTNDAFMYAETQRERIRMTHTTLRLWAVFFALFGLLIVANLANAKPCGRGHIPAAYTCHK